MLGGTVKIEAFLEVGNCGEIISTDTSHVVQR